MKIHLDTTYLLPAVGITIKSIDKKFLLNLLQKNNEISICDITIFELSAKAAKHIINNELTPNRAIKGIKAITYNEQLKKISTYQTNILQTAFKLKVIINDFIDCLIVSAAVHYSDVLITEDNEINSLKNNKDFIQLTKTINPKFEIKKINEIK